MRSLAALCAVVLLVPSLCAADPFNQFRIPAHSWQSGTASFGLFASRTDVALNAGNARDRSGRLGLTMRIERAFDSDRRAHGLSLAARHDLWLGRVELLNQNQFPPSPVRDSQTGWARGPSGEISLKAFVRNYREASPFGMELSAAGFALWAEEMRGLDRVLDGFPPGYREESRREIQNNQYWYDASLAATVGHGVVRDATVVEAVQVLEQRLQEAGVLQRALTEATRAKLAQLLVVTPRLANVHDRPGRFVWREVERVLREDGSLQEGKLDAYAQLYALESYRIGPDVRRATGHFAGLTVRASHDHSLARYDNRTTVRTFLSDTLESARKYSYSSRFDAQVNRILVGPSIEYHRPVGWRWQWDLSSQVLFSALPEQHGLRTESKAGAAWLVADRWQAQVAFRHFREYLSLEESLGSSPVDSWSVRGVVALDYFLEDHLKLTARYDEYQQQARFRNRQVYETVDRFTRMGGVSLSLNYRFLGRVSAPGLMETMRPL